MSNKKQFNSETNPLSKDKALTEKEKDFEIQNLVDTVRFGHICDDDLKELANKSYTKGYNKARQEITLLKKGLDGIEEDLHLAKQCIDFQGIKCDNKTCLNLNCPLNIKGEKDEL